MRRLILHRQTAEDLAIRGHISDKIPTPHIILGLRKGMKRHASPEIFFEIFDWVFASHMHVRPGICHLNGPASGVSAKTFC
jgi:hypothetical protein